MYPIFAMRLLIAIVVLGLLLCSVFIQLESYVNSPAIVYDSAMASRMADLNTPTDYNCIKELTEGSRIIKTDATTSKGVGSDAATALGESNAKIERDKAEQQQNAETTEANALNDRVASSLVDGKGLDPNYNTQTTTTGQDTIEGRMLAIETKMNTLLNKP